MLDDDEVEAYLSRANERRRAFLERDLEHDPMIKVLDQLGELGFGVSTGDMIHRDLQCIKLS